MKRLMASRGGWYGLGLSLVLGVACGQSQDAAPNTPAGGIFGGTGGVIDAKPTAGQSGGGSGGTSSSAGSGGALPDVCANVPRGTVALIDNFNDGDSVAAYEIDREAYWFTVHDDTPGMLVPAGEFVPAAGGPDASFAAHLSAEGFTDWGAAFVANLSHKQATRCPYNASAFAGLRFVAKGRGTVRAQLSMPGVVDKEYGGFCDTEKGEICYDLHGTFISLTEEYRVYEVPWSQFVQRAYGKQVPFDAATIYALQFSFETPDLPVDFWLDDVAFWDGVPHGTGSGGAGGEGGGAGGQAAGGQGGVGEAGDGGTSPDSAAGHAGAR
jgi:hypothetical protein